MVAAHRAGPVALPERRHLAAGRARRGERKRETGMKRILPQSEAAMAVGRPVAGVDRKWWVLLAVGVGTFMSALDGSVVNTILPVVTGALGSDIATVQWVV